MSTVLGFLNINSFVSNTDGVTNSVGEISPKSYTYSREVKSYVSTDTNFLVFDITTLTGPEQAVIEAVNADAASKLNAVAIGLPGSIAMLTEVTTALGANVAGISIGPEVLNTVDGLNYPAWIEFTLTSNGFDWLIKVWLVDAYFDTEFTECFVEVILPFTDLTLMYLNYPLVVSTVEALDTGSLINTASSQITDPVTGYQHLTLELFNVNDLSQSIQIPFLIAYNGSTVVCTTTEFINAIQILLEASGSYTLAEWIIIIPDLVPINTYRVVANWGNIAVDNLALAAPLCSPTVDLIDGVGIAAAYWPGILEVDVLSHLQYSVALYKSIGLYLLPDENNPDGRLNWKTKFPDYLVIATNDSNISQLSTTTQTVIITLDQMIRLAETYVTGDTLDAGITKEVFGSYEYLSKRVLSIKLTVLTRESFLAI